MERKGWSQAAAESRHRALGENSGSEAVPFLEAESPEVTPSHPRRQQRPLAEVPGAGRRLAPGGPGTPLSSALTSGKKLSAALLVREARRASPRAGWRLPSARRTRP